MSEWWLSNFLLPDSRTMNLEAVGNVLQCSKIAALLRRELCAAGDIFSPRLRVQRPFGNEVAPGGVVLARV